MPKCMTSWEWKSRNDKSPNNLNTRKGGVHIIMSTTTMSFIWQFVVLLCCRFTVQVLCMAIIPCPHSR
jgi:hypothetical protein